MDNEWKNSLRERFSDYSAPEPEGLWEGIEQGIAGKPRRKMLPVWIVSGLAAAAAVALVVLLPTRKATEPNVLQPQGDLAVVASADASVAEPVEATEVDVTEPAGVPASHLVPFAVKSRQTLLSEAKPAVIVTVPIFEESVPDAVHEIVPDQVGYDDHTVAETKRTEETEENVETLKTEETVEEVLRNRVPFLEISPAPTPGRKRFSIGAYQGGGQAARERSQGFGLNRTGDYLTRATANGAPKKTGDLMNMLSSNHASTYQAHHGVPIRTGFTAAWELSKHLSLASGVNWTSLSSNFDERTEGDTHTSTRQNLGYLGIPLRLEAGFEPVERLRLYAGAGGMVEKGLLSSSKTESYIGDHLEDTVTGHPDTGGLLWSVGALAGAEYSINRLVGVYVAPGIEYHFDNGAEARSAYTEKPLHWNVNLGVRFNFGK